MEQKNTEELLKERLREKGLKVTHQRLLVLSVLEQNSGRHMTPEDSDELVSDNAGLMLLKLLVRCGGKAVYLAGFDGFHHRHNWAGEGRQATQAEIAGRRSRIRRQLRRLAGEMSIAFLTPSVYAQEEPDV